MDPGYGYPSPPLYVFDEHSRPQPLSMQQQAEWEAYWDYGRSQRAQAQQLERWWHGNGYHPQPQQQAPMMRSQTPAYSNGPLPQHSAYRRPVQEPANYDNRRYSENDVPTEYYEHTDSYRRPQSFQPRSAGDQGRRRSGQPRERHSSRSTHSSSSRSGHRSGSSSRHSEQASRNTSDQKHRKEFPRRDFHEIKPDDYIPAEEERGRKYPDVGHRVKTPANHKTEDAMRTRERDLTPPQQPQTPYSPYSATCESVDDEGEPEQQLVKHDEKKVKFATEPPKVYYTSCAGADDEEEQPEKKDAAASILAYAATVGYEDEKPPKADKGVPPPTEKRVSHDADSKTAHRVPSASVANWLREQPTANVSVPRETKHHREDVRPAGTKVDNSTTKSKRFEPPVSIEDRVYEAPRVAPVPQPVVSANPFAISEPFNPRPLPSILRPNAPFLGDPGRSSSKTRSSSTRPASHSHTSSARPASSHASTARPGTSHAPGRGHNQKRHSDQPRRRHEEEDDPKTVRHDGSPRRHRRSDLDSFLRHQGRRQRQQQQEWQRKQEEERQQQPPPPPPRVSMMTTLDFEDGLAELGRTASRKFSRMRSDDSLNVCDGFQQPVREIAVRVPFDPDSKDNATEIFLRDQRMRMKITPHMVRRDTEVREYAEDDVEDEEEEYEEEYERTRRERKRRDKKEKKEKDTWRKSFLNRFK
ncbi:hypothetical protein GGR53DRAFT_463829 [Hypoxylon sp. FL1150]|nr:hypothetical protein GGR53DRAFT_463829 [Hypoxylon sp. FL1150]